MKLLSPVGNLESLKSAILGGADEVYLGVNDFNARNNIDGFTIDNLKQAVDYSHLFGVKVLLAVNILFSDEELNLIISLKSQVDDDQRRVLESIVKKFGRVQEVK